MLNIKQELELVKQGQRTSIGLLAEFTAPEAIRLGMLYNNLREPIHYIFCIDVSGSMAGDRIETVKETLLGVIPRLQHGDSVSIVGFNDRVQRIMLARRVQEVHPVELRDIVKRLTASGNTNMQVGIDEALRIANPELGKAKLILLSDGKVNNGITNRTELAGLIRQHEFGSNVATVAIGIGLGYDEDLLNAITEIAEGAQYAGINLDEAMRALQSELTDLVPPTYESPTVSIELNRNLLIGAPSIKLHGDARFAEGDSGYIDATLHNMGSGQIRNYLFELEIEIDPALPVNQSYTIGSVRLQANNAESGVQDVLHRSIEVRVIDGLSRVEIRRDPDVQAEMRQVRIDRARAQIIDLINNGDDGQALAFVRELEADIREVLKLEGLTDRARQQMNTSLDEFSSYLGMDPIELKKRMYEAKNRKDRGRDDFRGRN